VRHRSRKTILNTTDFIDCSLLLVVASHLNWRGSVAPQAVAM
jgi:hypothetical protein